MLHIGGALSCANCTCHFPVPSEGRLAMSYELDVGTASLAKAIVLIAGLSASQVALAVDCSVQFPQCASSCEIAKQLESQGIGPGQQDYANWLNVARGSG